MHLSFELPLLAIPCEDVIFALFRRRRRFLKYSKLNNFLMSFEGGSSLEAHDMTMQFAIKAMPISNMTAVKNFCSSGKTSDVGGIWSEMIIIKTASDSSVVMTSPMRSPESGGKLKDRKAKNEIRVLGTMVFIRKNRARLRRCSVYVSSGYGSGQHEYFLTVRATLKSG